MRAYKHWLPVLWRQRPVLKRASVDIYGQYGFNASKAGTWRGIGMSASWQYDDKCENCYACCMMQWSRRAALGVAGSPRVKTGSINHVSVSPLCLLCGLESLQNGDLLLQRVQPSIKLGPHLGLITSQLCVEVLAIRRGGHGRAEYWFHEEAVVGLQGVAVGGAEGGGEFVGLVGKVVAEGLSGKVEAAKQSLTLCSQ